MCECFKIGGPWIAEDPDCPYHGVEGQRDRAAFEALQIEVQDLRSEVAAMRKSMATIPHVRLLAEHVLIYTKHRSPSCAPANCSKCLAEEILTNARKELIK